MNKQQKVRIDEFVIRSSDFALASLRAAEMNLHISEWTWLPAYTISRNVQIFRRIHDENDG